MSLQQNVLIWRILIIIILYILQGFIQGFTRMIPLFLASYKASWQQQGTFNWVHYPFSFKILWAPIIYSVYSPRFGLYETWLVPIQITIGVILLILSFYLESLLVNLNIFILTMIFFFIYFLISSQDVVVDGWSVSLFVNSNAQWTSTCQTIGQVIGQFIGFTVLLTLESSNFTNKYIRSPLSLPHRSEGLFSLQQFTLFWSLIFIIVSILIAVSSFYKKQSNKKNDVYMEEETQTKLDLFETYLSVFKLLKKRCIRQLAFILLTYNVGFAATVNMTSLVLLGYGITRDTLALLNIPLLVVHILVPVFLSGTRRPLIWFGRGYIPRLVCSLILAIYIFFTPRILHTSYFYCVLIVLLCLNEAFVYLSLVSRIGFYARISEPRIAGTYMTLVSTIGNLGKNLSSTLVLYIASWLPRSHAYSIEVGACFLLGFIWIGLTWRLIRRLDDLPVEKWYLEPSLPMSVPLLSTNSHSNITDDHDNVSAFNA